MPCRTLLLGRSSDTYGVSRVPWLPAVPSIAYGALNDKDGNDIWAIRSPLRCLWQPHPCSASPSPPPATAGS